jgi:ferritin-like metal-binding protein YciE
MLKETASGLPASSAGANLGTLLIDELKDIYGAEKHQLLLLALVKNAASSLKLRSVLAGHLDCTRDHVIRLEEVFTRLGQNPEDRRSEALLGIAREIEIVIGETAPGTATRDAGLILSAQKLEHYEIATYGSLSQLARTLENDELADTLESILNEEKDLDDLLTSLAENYINSDAVRENPAAGYNTSSSK